MAKRVLNLGNGKWCWTEGCAVHSQTKTINPRSEAASVALRNRAIETLRSLPPKQEIAFSPNGGEAQQQYQESQINLEDAKLHLAIVPKERKKLKEALVTNSFPKDRRKQYEDLYNDSTELLAAYERNRSRYFLGGIYSDKDSKDKVQAIPLSIDNISEVNEWVANFYNKDESDWNTDTVDDDDSTVDSSSDDDSDEEVASATKTKTKIFNKKNKLYYRDHSGKDVELKAASYLVRSKGPEEFELKDGKSFESKHSSLLEEQAGPPKLKVLGRERLFPSKNLSTFVRLSN